MKGSVVKRGETWSYVLDLPSVDGRRQQRKKGGFRTRKLAEEALSIAKVEIIQGQVVSGGTQLLGDWLDEWLAAIQTSVRRSTYSSYHSIVNNWIKPRIGKVRLQDLTTGRIQALYNELSATGRMNGAGGLSPRSVALTHQALLLALARATDWRLIQSNPATGNLSLPRTAKKVAQTWSADEARQFLEATASDSLGPLWVLMLATALRRGEALGLRWDDIYGHQLHVIQNLVVVRHELIISEPKTASSRRTIGLHPTVEAVLAKHFAATGSPESGFVFRHPDGSPLHPEVVRRSFYRACARAKVRRIRLHDLRHTAATLALNAGVHPKLVSVMLGHSSIAITMDIYSHVQPSMAREATDQIGGMLFGQLPGDDQGLPADL